MDLARAADTHPEWFFRGNGSTLVACGQPLPQPDFALGGGEEPEVVGLYVIADDGTPCRLGWALGNEFTDQRLHGAGPRAFVAQAKLRTSAVGPELLLGELPAQVQGTSRLRRGGQVVWEKPFATGEANMAHSIAQLEANHFSTRCSGGPATCTCTSWAPAWSRPPKGRGPAGRRVRDQRLDRSGLPLSTRCERVSWTAPKVRVL